MARLWWLILVFLLPSHLVLAADAQKPHEHAGLLAPYPTPPTPTRLTEADLAKLGRGDPVYKQTEGPAGGRGVAVFRVHAPAATVWSTIADFSMYPEWIDVMKTSEIYKREGDTIWVRFILKSMGISVEYFIKHEYRADQTWGTWTLDYTRESDLNDSVGSWLVREVSPGVSQVEYSVDLKVSSWLPGFVRTLLVDNGLEEATQWVRIQSEAKASK